MDDFIAFLIMYIPAMPIFIMLIYMTIKDLIKMIIAKRGAK